MLEASCCTQPSTVHRYRRTTHSLFAVACAASSSRSSRPTPPPTASSPPTLRSTARASPSAARTRKSWTTLATTTWAVCASRWHRYLPPRVGAWVLCVVCADAVCLWSLLGHVGDVHCCVYQCASSLMPHNTSSASHLTFLEKRRRAQPPPLKPHLSNLTPQPSPLNPHLPNLTSQTPTSPDPRACGAPPATPTALQDHWRQATQGHPALRPARVGQDAHRARCSQRDGGLFLPH